MKRIRVSLGERSYEILIGHGLISNCGSLIKRLNIGRDAVVVTNSRLSNLYKKALTRTLKKNGITAHFEIVPNSEKSKSISVATALLNRLSRYDLHKRIFIIALGGGVVGDLAGFVASVYKRGVPYIQIPTTLLAQVDSSIGGKVGIDLPIGKNLVGSFYQPKVVITDVSAIKTLPARQVRNGLAEIVKYGIVRDAGLFKFLESNFSRILGLEKKALEHVVSRSSKIKAEVVSRDELDTRGVRAALNYGHTLGHAIESASGYSKRYNHGEAVALGMLIAGRIAVELGMLKETDARRAEDLIRKVGLPTSVKGVAASKIYASHLHDKKFIGRHNRFVLATRIGGVKIVERIPDSAIRNALKSYIDN